MSEFLIKTSGQGEALTVIHGWGMNSQIWNPIRENLESHYQVNWVDLPGHGFNRNIAVDSLDEIVRLIDGQLNEPSHFLAWSLGGIVAQALAHQYPAKVGSLFLVASTPRFSQTTDWPHAMPNEILDQFSENLLEDFEATLKRFIALQFMGVENGKQQQKVVFDLYFTNEKMSEKWGGVLLPSKQALDLGLSILKNADLRFTDYSATVHWLFGGRDRLIPKAVINDLKSLRTDDQITLLDNAGHAPFLTHTDEFLSTLNAFLGQH